MSLRFVFGGSGAGKSTRIYTEILERAAKEPARNFLIIVPDQFTMQTQKELVTHPANTRKGIMNIDVLSFGRLSHRIFEEVGKKEIPVLDDTGKSLVLRKVAGQLKEELPYLGSNLDKQGYIHEVKSAISEFMQYGIGVEDVTTLMEYAKKKGALFYKLKDLQVLYKGFTEYIHEKFITTEETLDLLRTSLGRSAIVKDSVIVFDGFTGFTPIQNSVIEELMILAKEVILTVTLDVRENPFEQDGEQKLFHLSKKTVADLVKLAEEAGVERGEDIYADYAGEYRFTHNAALAHLESTLFRYPVKAFAEEAQEAVHLFAATTIQEEVRQTGILIQKLVREQGYQYRDIAVVSGDLEGYGEQIQTEFDMLQIPCFLDRTRGIVLNPLTEYIKSALEVLIKDFSYESVFRYLRSGLAGFAQEEIDVLENYCVQTGIRGKYKWSRQFTHKTAQMQDDVEALALLEDMRKRFMEELRPLLEKKVKTADECVEALYTFLVQNKAAEKLAAYERMFAEKQDLVREREYAQVYRLVMELLEQVMGLLAGECMDIKEFKEILEAGFAEIEVGTIPQNVDRVPVGDIERTRLKQVKVLFLVGVNDGNIPKNAGKGGIISDIDREFLRQSELELAPSPRQQMYIQRLYLYLNMTKPSDRLYLSYAAMNGEGKSIRPSYLIGALQQIFPGLSVEYPENAPKLEQIYTPQAGMPYLAEALREYALYGSEDVFTLYRAYEEKEEYHAILQKLTDAAFYRYEHKGLNKAVARALYGQMLRNSVSRLETYASCAYRHFLQYGMTLQEREEFAFESVDMGNVFHGVLEGFSRKLEESTYTWFDFPKEFAENTVEEVLSLYAAGYGDTVLYDSARNEYALKRMKRILDRTVLTLQYQLKKGSFTPESYEMSFSSVSDLESVNIALSGEEKMQLLGKIDRVDVCESEDRLFVKIVDYKSGNRQFNLAALYYGLQLQLVVYMNAALDKEQRKHPDKEVIPAAMLYYHVYDPVTAADTELTPEEINAAILEQLRAGGVVNSEDDIAKRLDGETEGKSDVIPIEYKKDGSLSSRSSVMTGEELAEISAFVNKKVRTLGREILDGNIAVNPCESGTENACTYCSFKGVCGFEGNIPGYQYRKLPDLDKEEVMERIRQENE
ncbi:MAG: helicase-exonuclease AddAB subunit AddB [Lachnospiraceae bacterium]|nr:helicase-exonuclease AddAB subunit AddB [Lachnospiraceae bacterium]